MTFCFFKINIFAQNIQAVGENVAIDKKGNKIYQVESNGIKIGYKLIGKGEPLVMITGVGWSMEKWPQKVIEILSKKYQLILLDNRGIGYSTADKKEFSYALFADDVIALMDNLSIKKSNILGFSMGSTIVQKLLLEYPNRINKAILYATSTDGNEVLKKLKGKIPKNITIRRQLEATKRWKTPMQKLWTIKNQVMLVIGSEDKIVGQQSSKDIAQKIPDAWLVQFKNTKHILMIQIPVKFSKIVSIFLEEK